MAGGDGGHEEDDVTLLLPGGEGPLRAGFQTAVRRALVILGLGCVALLWTSGARGDDMVRHTQLSIAGPDGRRKPQEVPTGWMDEVTELGWLFGAHGPEEAPWCAYGYSGWTIFTDFHIAVFGANESTSWMDCCNRCNEEPSCQFWTYGDPATTKGMANGCYLKQMDDPNPKDKSGCPSYLEIPGIVSGTTQYVLHAGSLDLRKCFQKDISDTETSLTTATATTTTTTANAADKPVGTTPAPGAAPTTEAANAADKPVGTAPAPGAAPTTALKTCSDGLPLEPLGADECPGMDVPTCDHASPGALCTTHDGQCGTDESFINCDGQAIYRKAAACKDGLPLEPVRKKSKCPTNMDVPMCDADAAGPGELCKADGQCGTDKSFSNCDGQAIYLKAAACSDGLPLELVDIGECPTNMDLPACDAAGPGKQCIADDGECGVREHVPNCEGKAVYRKSMGVGVTAAGTTPSSVCSDGLPVEPVAVGECPASMDVPMCDDAGPGALCKADDGQCGTDKSFSNCDGQAIYRKAAACKDGLPLEPVLQSSCPTNMDVPTCDADAAGPGELCKADGQCGTDKSFSNCDGQAIYLKAAACSDGLPLEPVDESECPTNMDLPACDAAGPGKQCIADDGECGADKNLKNCEGKAVYLKSKGAEVTTAGTTSSQVCSDGLPLEPVAAGECPASMDVPTCDDAGPGALCKANDGQCGTDKSFSNCDGQAIYRKAGACSDGLPLKPVVDCPSSTDLPACEAAGPGELCKADGQCSTDKSFSNCDGQAIYLKAAACGDGLPLEPVDESKCPTNLDLPTCDAADPGLQCIADDGECGADKNLKNCEGKAVYLKSKGAGATTASTTPSQTVLGVCRDGSQLKLSSECPPNPTDLPMCESVEPGFFCRADGGQCGTDNNLKNCGGTAVYSKEQVASGGFAEWLRPPKLLWLILAMLLILLCCLAAALVYAANLRSHNHTPPKKDSPNHATPAPPDAGKPSAVAPATQVAQGPMMPVTQRLPEPPANLQDTYAKGFVDGMVSWVRENNPVPQYHGPGTAATLPTAVAFPQAGSPARYDGFGGYGPASPASLHHLAQYR